MPKRYGGRGRGANGEPRTARTYVEEELETTKVGKGVMRTKVKELIKALQDCAGAGNYDILISIDDEGNAFKKIHSISVEDKEKEVIIWLRG